MSPCSYSVSTHVVCVCVCVCVCVVCTYSWLSVLLQTPLLPYLLRALLYVVGSRIIATLDEHEQNYCKHAQKYRFSYEVETEKPVAAKHPQNIRLHIWQKV